MDLSLLVTKIFAWNYLFIGISLLIHRRFWAESIESLKEDCHLVVLLFGFLILPLGLMIVFAHNVWAFEPTVFISIIGWVMVIEAIAWLLFPHKLQSLIPSRATVEKLIIIDIVLFLVFPGLILYNIYC